MSLSITVVLFVIGFLSLKHITCKLLKGTTVNVGFVQPTLTRFIYISPITIYSAANDQHLPVSFSPASWPVDHGLLYSIETLIVQWSEQIWNVLKKDSGKVLLRGDHPGPLVELQFWTTQKENLLGIQSQVCH